MSEDDKVDSFICQKCGRCCKADSLLQGDASIQDIARWIQDGRYDILKWVAPFPVPDSEEMMFDVWVDRKTQDYAKRCPWLQKESDSNLFVCTIYEIRPRTCREWPWTLPAAQIVGCPACQQKLPRKTKGKVIKVSKPHRDDDDFYNYIAFHGSHCHGLQARPFNPSPRRIRTIHRPPMQP
jgi:Fe-S-cluster containining protein